MKKRYQYYAYSIFDATDGNRYEIAIPSPNTYETKEEAMADKVLGYRFVLLPDAKGPQVVIFKKYGSTFVKDEKEKYVIKDWVGGYVFEMYDFNKFTKTGGYIRLLNPLLNPKRGNVGIIEDSDFLETHKTFADIFPNMKQLKPYYIDAQAYSINEISE